MLHQDDALAISPYVDALLVVIAEGETAQQELVRIGQLIGNKPLLGTVLNKSQRATKSKAKKSKLWDRLFNRSSS